MLHSLCLKVLAKADDIINHQRGIFPLAALFTLTFASFPHLVKADLDVMRRDSKLMRGDKPFVFTNCFTGEGIDTLVEMIEQLALIGIVEQ